MNCKQLQDNRLKEIAENFEFKDDDKFILLDGLVYRKQLDKHRFIVPDALINNVICVYHNELAHYGFEKTVQDISSNYWFPSL